MRVGCREEAKIKSEELDPGLRRDDEVGASPGWRGGGTGSQPSPGRRSWGAFARI